MLCTLTWLWPLTCVLYGLLLVDNFGPVNLSVRHLSKTWNLVDLICRCAGVAIEAFFILICLNLQISKVFTLLEMICPIIWAKPLPKNAKSPLPVDMFLLFLLTWTLTLIVKKKNCQNLKSTIEFSAFQNHVAPVAHFSQSIKPFNYIDKTLNKTHGIDPLTFPGWYIFFIVTIS